MTSSAAVRVLPPRRPEARTWQATAVHREPREPDLDPNPRPRPGRVAAVGRAWAAPLADDLPEVTRWSGWLAVALGEAVLGRRPATQLSGCVSPEVLAGLARRQRLRAAETPAPRVVLLSGRVQHPARRVAEASAVLRVGTRLLVLAFRLEGIEGRWVCTALDAGLTPARRQPGRGAGAAASPAGTGAA